MNPLRAIAGRTWPILKRIADGGETRQGDAWTTDAKRPPVIKWDTLYIVGGTLAFGFAVMATAPWWKTLSALEWRDGIGVAWWLVSVGGWKLTRGADAAEDGIGPRALAWAALCGAALFIPGVFIPGVQIGCVVAISIS